jgi:hypothetical protein
MRPIVLALVVLPALAGLLVLCGPTGCDFELGFGQSSSTGIGADRMGMGRPNLSFSPHTTVRAAPFQPVEVVLSGAQLRFCRPQVLFGERPVAVLSQSSDLTQPTKRLRLRVAVPSHWQGDFEVTLRCGDFALGSDKEIYHARPVGWFAAAVTGYDSFAEEPPLLCSAVAVRRDDGGVEQFSFGDQGALLRRRFSGERDRLSLETEVLDGLAAARGGWLLSAVHRDLDRDGRAELVWSDWTTLRLAERDVDGRWTLVQRLELGPLLAEAAGAGPAALKGNESIWSMAAGDLDGDGDDDLVLVMDDAPPQVVLYQAGRLQHLPAAVAGGQALDGTDGVLLDIDADGDLDLIAGTGWYEWGSDVDYRDRVYRNRGDGRFAAAEPLSEQSTNTWLLDTLAPAGQPLLLAGQLNAPPALFRVNGDRLEALGDLGIDQPGMLRAWQADAGRSLVQLDTEAVPPKLRRWDWEPGAGLFRLVHAGPLPPGMSAVPAPFVVMDLDGDEQPDLLTPAGLWLWRELDRAD